MNQRDSVVAREKAEKKTIEGQGGTANKNVMAPSATFDQASGACAQRTRGGRGQKAGAKSAAAASKGKSSGGTESVLHGAPAIAGGGQQSGEKAAPEMGIKARGVKSGGQEGGKKGVQLDGMS